MSWILNTVHLTHYFYLKKNLIYDFPYLEDEDKVVAGLALGHDVDDLPGLLLPLLDLVLVDLDLLVDVHAQQLLQDSLADDLAAKGLKHRKYFPIKLSENN